MRLARCAARYCISFAGLSRRSVLGGIDQRPEARCETKRGAILEVSTPLPRYTCPSASSERWTDEELTAATAAWSDVPFRKDRRYFILKDSSLTKKKKKKKTNKKKKKKKKKNKKQKTKLQRLEVRRF